MRMRILLVDDMPIIVDGLKALIQDFAEEAGNEWDIRTATSGRSALRLLRNCSADIVITDIRMPKVDGLDLLRWIKRETPQAKVVVLTGYDNFEYAKAAVSNGAFDYILKVEGDSRILEVVDAAAQAIRQELSQKHLHETMRRQFNHARPELLQELLRELAAGRKLKKEELGEELRLLEAPFDPIYGLFLALVRIDFRSPKLNRWEQPFGMIATLEQVLNRPIYQTIVRLADNRLLWFIQETDGIHRKLDSALEDVKYILEHSYSLDISLAMTDKPVAWPNIAARAENLRRLLSQGLGLFPNALLSERFQDHSESLLRSHTNLAATEQHFSLETAIFEERLTNLDHEGALAALEAICRRFAAITGSALRLLVSQAISVAILRAATRLGLIDVLSARVNDGPSLLRREFGDMDSLDWAVRATRKLLDLASRDSIVARDRLTRHIQRFVEHSLGEATVGYIASKFGINASYLSRIYKDRTGQGLSSFIAERKLEQSKRLLLTTELPIFEIAGKLGYQAPASFDRFFKKQMKCTPHEYREKEGSESCEPRN